MLAGFILVVSEEKKKKKRPVIVSTDSSLIHNPQGTVLCIREIIFSSKGTTTESVTLTGGPSKYLA